MKLCQLGKIVSFLFISSASVFIFAMENESPGQITERISIERKNESVESIHKQESADCVVLQCTDTIVQFPLYLTPMCLTLHNMLGDTKILHGKSSDITLSYSAAYLNLLKACLAIIDEQTKQEKINNFQSLDRILRKDGKYIIKNVKKLLDSKLPVKLPIKLKELKTFIELINFLDVGCDQDNAFLLEIMISKFISTLLCVEAKELTHQEIKKFRRFIEDNYFSKSHLTDLCVEYFCLNLVGIYIKYDIADCIDLLDIKSSVNGFIDLCSQGITSLDGIESLNGITSLDDIERVNKIKKIDLSGNFITRIKKNNLARLLFLEKLEINESNIISIEPEALTQPTLKELYLQSNILSVLDQGMFYKLPKLEKLDVADNEIVEVQKSLLESLPTLKKLDLSYNKIMSINASGKNLKTINLSSNPLSTLKSGSFSNLPQLEKINLNETCIKKIEKGVFISEELPSFKKLKYNCIDSFKLAEKIATQLQKTISLGSQCVNPLEVDSLDFIKVKTKEGTVIKFPLYIVRMSQTLNALVGENNELINNEQESLLLAEFNEEEIRILKRILKLVHKELKRDKAYGRCTIIRPDGKYIQKTLKNLLKKALKDKPIKELVPLITMIYFFNIGLEKNIHFLVETSMALYVEASMQHMQKVEHSYEFVELSVDLLTKNSDYKQFEGPLINILREYVEFYIEGIYCKYDLGDCIILEKVSSIQDLDCRHKKITNLDGIDCIGTTVQILDLTGNHIKSVPTNCFKKCIALNTLQLACNKLKVIEPDSFANPTLQILELDHNFIERIPKDCFAKAAMLNCVDLSHNKIDTIEPSAFSNPIITSLILDENPFAMLDASMVAQSTNLSYLSVCNMRVWDRKFPINIQSFVRGDMQNLQKIAMNVDDESIILLEKLAHRLGKSFVLLKPLNDQRTIEPKLCYDIENSLDKCMIQ